MQGLHLSPVQEAALELTLVSEERLKAEDFFERFKLSVVGAGPEEWIPKMFPEWVRGAEEDEDDLDLSDTEGTWIFEDEDVTPEEAERVFAETLAEAGGTLTLGDLTDEGWE